MKSQNNLSKISTSKALNLFMPLVKDRTVGHSLSLLVICFGVRPVERMSLGGVFESCCFVCLRGKIIHS